MLENNNWAIQALKEKGITPEQAIIIAVKRLEDVHCHQKILEKVKSNINNLNGVGWEYIYDIVTDEDRVKNASKIFDFSKEFDAFNFLMSRLD